MQLSMKPLVARQLGVPFLGSGPAAYKKHSRFMARLAENTSLEGVVHQVCADTAITRQVLGSITDMNESGLGQGIFSSHPIPKDKAQRLLELQNIPKEEMLALLRSLLASLYFGGLIDLTPTTDIRSQCMIVGIDPRDYVLAAAVQRLLLPKFMLQVSPLSIS